MSVTPLKHNIGTTVVHGKTVAAGLYWQPMKDSRSLRTDAKAYGKAEHFEQFVVRKHKLAAQAGFLPPASGRNQRVASLASVLASVLGDNWIAAFDLADGRYAMCAVHGGAIMPGSDLLGTADVVRQNFQEISQLVAGAGSQWERVIAPAALGVGGQEERLSEIISPKAMKNEHRLRPIRIRISKRQLVIAVAVVATVLGGTSYAMNLIHQRAETKRQESIERAKKAIAQEEAIKAQQFLAAGPWSTRPAARTMIVTCANGWSRVPLTLAGWVFDNGRCTQGQMGVVYHRAGGATVEEFSMTVRPAFGEPIIRDNGDVAAVTFPLPMPVEEEKDLPPIADQANALLSHLQSLGAAVTMGELVKGGVPNDLKPGEPEPVALWHSHAFEMTTGMPPEVLFAGIDLKGLRINTIDVSVKYENAAMTWSIKGDLYGK